MSAGKDPDLDSGVEQPFGSVALPWVPHAVRDIAQAIAFKSDIATRLTSDARMKPVWKWLKRRAQEIHDRDELAERLSVLPKRWLLDHWGLSVRLGALTFEERAPLLGFSEDYAPLPDHACAAFCACVIITLAVNNQAVTRAGIEAQTREWRHGVDLCRAALAFPGRAQHDPELAAHLSAAAEYFEECAEYIESSAPLNRPYYLQRSCGERSGGDDNVRAHARVIAIGARAIFGEFLYGIVATVLSVARQTGVKERNVRDWCADLPPAIKPPV
jgi:hypothetical protein